MGAKKELFGEALIRKGLITKEQLLFALEEQKLTGELLGNILVRKKYISEEAMVRFLSTLLEIDYVDLSSVSVSQSLIDSVPDRIARKFKVIPLEKKGNTLVLAMANPQNAFAIDDLRRLLNCEIEQRIATISGIQEALDKYYGAKSRLKEIITSAEEEQDPGLVLGEQEKVYSVKETAENAPAIQLVNQLLVDSVRDRASDIHIEPQEAKVSVRFRIDGVLHEVIVPPKHMHDAIISRIKIMSRLDIAEKRMPQDGKFPVKVEGNDIDVRVSVYPTVYGEKAVMRILNRANVALGLDNLGLDEKAIVQCNALIHRPYGIILVTGPTGSGKTTTLYSVLETIKTPEKNLMTIEDPIEYQLKGVTQSQVSSRIGLTFARLLRSVMRQDPDIILVGEIRDLETAEVAIRAALTGHLVLSTLHTNDAAGAATRLIDMGVKPFLVSSAVIGIIAQRLVRTICPKCKQKQVLEPGMLENIELPPDCVLHKGAGCDHCHQTGYRGRTGIFEIMPLDEELRDLIAKKIATHDIRAVARQKGMRTLREDALIKAQSGVTTIEEVIRITGEEQS
jgi:type IV pilus assembly protein PilB